MSEQIFTSCTTEGPIHVYVRDGKVVRIRPLTADPKDFRPWTIEAGGRHYTPPTKFHLAPFIHAERERLYSKDRILYPMKRKDFDPKGKRNQEKRGTSGYERIGWDEALDIVSGEIKRITEQHGGAAITGITSSHHNWGIVGYKMGPFGRFMNMLEYTPIMDNPDSWEGWHWGAPHTWGFFWRLGIPEQYDLLQDTLQNTEMIVFWSNDPDTTRSIYSAQDSVLWRQWLKEKGVEMVFLDPFFNYTAAHMDHAKWFPLRPDSGTAVAQAIAYVWITEDTYDKDYVAERTVGFEEFKRQVLGKDDGLPKTPEWASEESGIPARRIRTLAREWASKRTMLSAGSKGGLAGASRQAYATEWARMMILLQAMQGLGKPGINIWSATMGAPSNTSVFFPGYADLESRMAITRAADTKIENATSQRLYRTLLPDAILNPPVEWDGDSYAGQSIEQQFVHYVYPMEGYPEVKMFYRYGGSFIGTMVDTNKWVKMYQSPKLEFVVNQDCWWGGETGFADVILPACTSLEREDIAESSVAGGYGMHGSNGVNFRVVVRMKKCIEPLGESKADYEIFTLLSERLGMKDVYTDGKTDLDWARKYFELSDLPKHISWEDFDNKGYFIINPEENYKPTPALRWFAEGRACDTPDVNNKKRGTEKARELGTYSGKIEFLSQSLLKQWPDDDERPPVPRHIPSWEGYRSELYKKYPLQLVSPHPRFSFHTHYDKHTKWLNEIPGHRIVKNGYAWWIARVHPRDAAARGIKNDDIIKLYNDRGVVLCIAVVTERVLPGIVHSYGSSASYDPLEPGKVNSIDRGGCVNLLTPSRMMSRHVPGMAPNSCLVEIVKWEE
ncbi:MAG: molybdopterin-dependent oxidoreductase [Syntrophorhabdales bacterium]|jgi:trimethylamine-N-oxide reductase (cytochrome c)